jgi:hypothetical protein
MNSRSGKSKPLPYELPVGRRREEQWDEGLTRCLTILASRQREYVISSFPASQQSPSPQVPWGIPVESRLQGQELACGGIATTFAHFLTTHSAGIGAQEEKWGVCSCDVSAIWNWIPGTIPAREWGSQFWGKSSRACATSL